MSVGNSTLYGNSIPYGKYVSNEHIEAKNPQKRSYQRIYQLLNPSLIGEMIPDKEKKISSLKLRGDKILPQEVYKGENIG